jgi:hypothetical protein
MPLTALPTAPAATDTPAVFSTRAYAFVAALATLVSEINALFFAYDFPIFYPGIPGNSQLLYRGKVARAFTFAANFSGSYFTATANATGSTVFDVQKNAVSIGTVTIGAGGVTPTFATDGGTSKSFAAGDILAIYGPASADATLANPSITLAGTR